MQNAESLEWSKTLSFFVQINVYLLNLESAFPAPFWCEWASLSIFLILQLLIGLIAI